MDNAGSFKSTRCDAMGMECSFQMVEEGSGAEAKFLQRANFDDATIRFGRAGLFCTQQSGAQRSEVILYLLLSLVPTLVLVEFDLMWHLRLRAPLEPEWPKYIYFVVDLPRTFNNFCIPWSRYVSSLHTL